MTDIKSPTLLWFKRALFLALGLFAATLVVVLAPRLSIALLLVVAIWAFCRAYYFAFYVVEHYVDPNFHYSGLLSLVRYALRNRRKERPG